jgi:hypothetical protein
MFFMPEYYPLQILLSGAFPENFLSAVLGRSVEAATEESRGGPIINYRTRTRTNWFPNSIRLRRSSSSASATAIDGNGPPRSLATVLSRATFIADSNGEQQPGAAMRVTRRNTQITRSPRAWSIDRIAQGYTV